MKFLPDGEFFGLLAPQQVAQNDSRGSLVFSASNLLSTGMDFGHLLKFPHRPNAGDPCHFEQFGP